MSRMQGAEADVDERGLKSERCLGQDQGEIWGPEGGSYNEYVKGWSGASVRLILFWWSQFIAIEQYQVVYMVYNCSS